MPDAVIVSALRTPIGTAVKAGISREEMDEWALGSHRKAIQAIGDTRHRERSPRTAGAGDHPVVGVGRRRSGVDRVGASRGDPESPCACTPFAGGRDPVRDQRGIRVDVCGDHRVARRRSLQGQSQPQRLLARPSGRRDWRADARHAGARTAQAGWRYRSGGDVCRRRNGFCHGHRGTRSLDWQG